MSRILLCVGKYAKEPYYVKNACVRVYCVEELCYLFVSNPFVIDSEIMDRELAEWLDRECGLTDLSHQLLVLFRRGSQASLFVNTILDYVNYCTPAEREKIEEVLQNNAGLSDFERRKKQGDFLLDNKKYRLALAEYDGLCRELPETESALKPALYHNMAVCYTGFFMFEAAAKYFKRAYEMSGREESGVQYLIAKRLSMREDQYIAFIAEHGEYHELSLKVERLLTAAEGKFEASEENRMLSALKIFKEEGNVASYYEEMDKVIGKLKDGYRELIEQ